MSRIVLDAGALIAIERNDRPMWAILKIAALEGIEVLVPSSALAQVWRGAPSQAVLSRALQHCVLASFDALARDVGELCGRTGTRDICDAHVALVAVRRAAVLYTSDVDDLRRLTLACGRPSVSIVHC